MTRGDAVDAYRAPLFLAWQLTNRCQARCVTCCEASGPDRAWRDELTRDEAIGLARAIGELGIPYVAFGGGISTPPVLGSRATHVVGRLGGVQGRALQPGDRLPLGEITGRSTHGKDTKWSRPVGQGTRLRVLPGPQDSYFTAQAMTALQQTRFMVSPQSDRMGYRLTTERPVAFDATGTMISDVTFLGGLQVPPSGSPILLMADRQTAGGYPQIVTVITADLPLAGQLAPGDWVEFEVCTRADAMAALIAQEGRLLAFG